MSVAWLPLLQTGDLLLMRSDGFASRFVQQTSGCPFCHLAVVVRVPELPQTPLLLEANPAASSNRATSAAQALTVVDVRSRLAKWCVQAPGNQVIVRRLVRPTSAPPLDGNTLLELVATTGVDVGGYAAGVPQLRALLQALHGTRFVDNLAELNAAEGLSCTLAAEAVAIAYRKLGVLDPAGPEPESYTVRDFAERPPLRPGWGLGTRVKVILS